MRSILPALLGYITHYFCPMNNNKNNGKKVPLFRPPPYVFYIVWPILYITLGISWKNNTRTLLIDSVYISLSSLLALWIYVYSCRNSVMGSVYVMLLSITSTIAGIIVSDNVVSQLLLTPLLTWLVFALLLNTHVL